MGYLNYNCRINISDFFLGGVMVCMSGIESEVQLKRLTAQKICSGMLICNGMLVLQLWKD